MESGDPVTDALSKGPDSSSFGVFVFCSVRVMIYNLLESSPEMPTLVSLTINDCFRI